MTEKKIGLAGQPPRYEKCRTWNPANHANMSLEPFPNPQWGGLFFNYNRRNSMKSLQEFCSAIEQRGFPRFGPNSLDIINVQYRRRCEDEGGIVATKHTNFHVIRWKRLCTPLPGMSQIVTDYWALREDLRFTPEHETFLPDEKRDEISFNCGIDWQSIELVSPENATVKFDDGHDTFVELWISGEN